MSVGCAAAGLDAFVSPDWMPVPTRRAEGSPRPLARAGLVGADEAWRAEGSPSPRAPTAGAEETWCARAMRSVHIVGHILAALDEATVEGLMEHDARAGRALRSAMRVDPGAYRRWPATVRSLNWAWRLGFDVCAPKTISRATYGVYASPARTVVARGVWGHSLGAMHLVRRLELCADDGDYMEFLAACSPAQLSAATVVTVVGSVQDAAGFSGVPCILAALSSREAPSGPTDAEDIHAPFDDANGAAPPGGMCAECARLSMLRDGPRGRGLHVVWEDPEDQISLEASSTLWCPLAKASLRMFLRSVRGATMHRVGDAAHVVDVASRTPAVRELTLSMDADEWDGTWRSGRSNPAWQPEEVRGVTSLTIDPAGGVDVPMLRRLCNDRARANIVGQIALMHGGTLGEEEITENAFAMGLLDGLGTYLLLPGVAEVSFLGGPHPAYVPSFCMPAVKRVRFEYVSLPKGEAGLSIARHGRVYASMLDGCFPACEELWLTLRDRAGAWGWCRGDDEHMEDAYPARHGFDGRGYLLETIHALSGRGMRAPGVSIHVDPVMADLMRLSGGAGDAPDYVSSRDSTGFYILGRFGGDVVAVSAQGRCCRAAPRSSVVCRHASAPVASPPGGGDPHATLHVVCRSCSEWLDAPHKLSGDGVPWSARAC